MTNRPPGLDKLLDYVTERLDEPTNCARCGHAFNPTDTRFDGRARYKRTPYCHRCIDNCHGSEDPCHRCVVCHQY
jgi:hypothetical protein